MTTVAVVEVDLRSNGLGLPSRALEPFGESCVLGRVLGRLADVAGVDDVVVVAPERDHDLLRPVVDCSDARLDAAQCDDLPFRPLLRTSRLWAAEGWRGGVGGMTVFDEHTSFAELDRVAEETGADVLVSVRAEAPLLDPEIVAALLADHVSHDGDVRFTFSTAPPGLAAEAYRPAIVKEFVASRQTPGLTMKYYPAKPAADIIDQPCTYKLDTAIVGSPWRYLADSARWLDRARRLDELAGGGAAADLLHAMAGHPELWGGPLARDIEVEVTTARPVRDPFLPGPEELGAREPMSLDAFTALATAIGRAADDCVLTLGGFGDALEHPDVVPMVEAAHAAGVLGTALVTDGLALTGELAERLIRSPLAAIVVRLDAHAKQTYAALKGVDAYDRVKENIDRFVARRAELDRNQPLLIVQMTKTHDSLAEMPEFFDHWMTHADWATIVSPNTFGGRRPDLAVIPDVPLKGWLHQRLSTSLMVLANGVVPACYEDYAAEFPIGNVVEAPIDAIWRGPRMAAVRQAASQASTTAELFDRLGKGQ